MSCLITCPECAKQLGQIRDLYVAMRADRIKEFLGEEHIDINPNLIMLLETQGLVLGDILDALNLDTECCRVHMMMQVDIKEYM